MLIVEGQWHAQLATFTSKKSGLINYQKKEDGEEDMLDMAFEPKKNSRLSCQLMVSDQFEGLVVNLPEKQV